MKKKRTNLGYYIKEGFSSIFTHGFMSFASISIIVACLLIMGAFSLIVVNINALIGEVESKNEITAYVDENYTEDEARALEGQVLAVNNVSGATFVTKEEAMKDFVSPYDDSNFEEIGSETFRDRFEITIDDIALMEQTMSDLDQIDGIVKVNAATELVDVFLKIRNIVSIVSIALVAILLIISIFIISNTTKLATFDRRDEIAIMKMVGATNSFIRWPFVFQGFLLGVSASLVAFVLIWAGYALVGDWIVSSGLVTIVSFSILSQWILIGFVGTGFIVGVLGSVVTIRNYLKV